MKKKITLIITLFSLQYVFSQQDEKIKFDEEKFLKELTENACKCIDSIETSTKIKDSINSEINVCIDKQVGAFQLGSKLAELGDIENIDQNEKINIEINYNVNSKDYKKYYYKLERSLNSNCKALKRKIAINDALSEKSLSKNEEAMSYFNKGTIESANENYEQAIIYYKKAIDLDKNFAFAYDNLGISYRKLNQYDDAIKAYKKSLKIDPNGQMPLQNIAIAYIYKKDYKNAIKSYLKLSELDNQNPEVFYGIGSIYVKFLSDYENGLDNLCIAYNIYVQTKSPYRSDAEKLINFAYLELKKLDKEAIFFEILKKHNISSN